MLNEQTVEKLYGMKLFGMAESFRSQLESAEVSGLSFEERFALLVDQQWTWRENRASGAPAPRSQTEGARRHRGHQLSASAPARSQADAHR